MTSMSTMLYPLVWLLETTKLDHLDDTYINNNLKLFPSDVHLVTASLIIQQFEPAIGLVLHRTQTTQCYGSTSINHSNSNTVSNLKCENENLIY